MSLPFDPAEPIGDGRTVIEASAGTGKTFTIAAAVTRLVAHEGLDLEQVLVVTFTRAATAELKDRVRRRMVDTLDGLERPRPGRLPDAHMALLIGADHDLRAIYAARLRAALTRFDRAQIFTIHGFAHRLLSLLGFRVRLSPDLEPGSVDHLLIKEVATDLIVDRFVANPDDAEVLTPASAAAITDAIVTTPDAVVVPPAGDVGGLGRTRVEMAHAMSREVRRRMRIKGAITFDDGPMEVLEALADDEVGAAARELLRRRYVIGLVDESQDTDPIQWEVIRSVFAEARLVVIGDPKQSIYSFRGADVESYLAAVAGADTRRTLVTNWRSDGPLIRALDVLFEGVIFGDERIQYHRVEAAPGNETSRLRAPGPPMSVRRFHPEFPIRRRKDGYFYIDPAREAVAQDAAAEVVALLTAESTLEGKESRPLGPGDIGVLCRTRKQVDLIRAELGRRGVPSVAARTGGVFTSLAAEDWRRFLLAVERPDRMDYVRLAATTPLVGLGLGEIASLSDEDAVELQQQMRHWQRRLHDHGVPALVAAVNRVTGMAARVLALADGERRMTDLTHIAEEMHAVWRRGRAASLVAWLEVNMAEASERESRNIEEPESRQRRLETDAEAVQVQTIHGAKGLQYPVVLVPYSWDVPPMSPDIPVFHQPVATAVDVPRRRLVDVAGPGWPGFDDHVGLAMAEDKAEEGRLLYVALTRAQHRLVVWWIEDAETCADTKLTELIRREGRSPDDLVRAAGGTIDMPVVTGDRPIRSYRPPATDDVGLDRARFSRSLDHHWQRASFSSLSSSHPVARGAEVGEQSWRDDELEVDEEIMSVTSGTPLPMADLPGGARFGTLVHTILEQVRFDGPDLHEALQRVTAAETRAGGWDFDPGALVDGLLAALETPLGPDPDTVSLRDLDSNRLFDELSFDLPVRTGRGVVGLNDIGEVMRRHLPSEDPYLQYASHLLTLETPPFRGYLAGAIDLTSVLPGPSGDRYVVMDYKSNTLPTLAASAVFDYGPGPLATTMMEGHYVLQATLYQVALHRYLQWRLPDYDPSTHLGGAIYLFVRGMIGKETPTVDGERCGVARWHPPAEMIVALSRLFVGDAQ